MEAERLDAREELRRVAAGALSSAERQSSAPEFLQSRFSRAVIIQIIQ